MEAIAEQFTEVARKAEVKKWEARLPGLVISLYLYSEHSLNNRICARTKTMNDFATNHC